MYYDDNRLSTFECCWSFKGEEARSMNALAEYQNERTFFAQISGKLVHCSYDDLFEDSYSLFTTPLIRFFFLKPRNCGFKIAEVAMVNRSCDKWIPIKLEQQNKEVGIFLAQMDTNVNYSYSDSIKFRIKMSNTTEKHCFVDKTWITDLWSEKQFTDVDVLVGQNKLQAHRVVLSARSPVFKTLINNTGRNLTINEDVDFSVVQQLLKYLYTGTLEISANNKQLLELAKMYQVETLKEICQLAVRVFDAEDITTSFLAFI